MDYKTKSAYIENEITPILMPQGFRYETWEADGDGNGWQYVRGSQKIEFMINLHTLICVSWLTTQSEE